MSAEHEAGGERLRLDKWLWYARFHKSRTLAASACATGRIRLNGTLIVKANQLVKPGDVLTFALGSRIRIIRVLALGVRRGPFPEARALYDDLSPETTEVAPGVPPAVAVRPAGTGRPTKSERRATDRLRDEE